jgi:hypothetical protein
MIPILMYQMCISTNYVMLRPKRLEIQKIVKTDTVEEPKKPKQIL